MTNAIFRTARRWFSDSPESALEQAYQAALTIKAIEDRHFDGQSVFSPTSARGNTTSYFQTEVKKYLRTAKIGLAEFEAGGSLPTVDERTVLGNAGRERETFLLEKLRFVSNVVSKYERDRNGIISGNSTLAARNQDNGAIAKPVKGQNTPPLPKQQNQSPDRYSQANQVPQTETISDKTGILPRSFLRTFNRIRQEIDPNSVETEEQVLDRFRRSRNKTAVSVKFFLILIIAPLLTHQITKTFIISPIVDRFFTQNEQVIFVNRDLEEEAFIELQRFEESLRFRSLLGTAPALSAEEEEAEIREKALEIAEGFRYRGSDAISNIFADICSLAAFATIILTSRKEILIVKSFIDELIYGLSDSAKAFLIILVTDIFVGYHSPHGWEVILEGIARHFGLPENREFDFLFIATFPVILDTVLKYWIFRYLNRISPSAVATYRNMNE